MCEIQDALSAAMGLNPLPPPVQCSNGMEPAVPPKRESNADYHSDLAHVGSTMLREYRKSPARYNALYVARTIERGPPSNAMVLGSLTHALIDEPDAWQREFLLADGCNSRRGKNWDAYAEEAARRGLIPILDEQLLTAKAMAAAVLAHPIARQLLGGPGPVEQSIRWQHECGLKLKCKPDKLLLDPACDIVIDLKTSRDPGPDAWPRLAYWTYQYHLQAALYLDGVHSLGGHRPSDFVFIVVGNESPHEVWCYQCHKDLLQAARDELDVLYHRLQRSLTSGDWSAPQQYELNVLKLPAGAGGSGEDVDLIIDGEEVSV
jgi:hypothetical protein